MVIVSRAKKVNTDNYEEWMIVKNKGKRLRATYRKNDNNLESPKEKFKVNQKTLVVRSDGGFRYNILCREQTMHKTGGVVNDGSIFNESMNIGSNHERRIVLRMNGQKSKKGVRQGGNSISTSKVVPNGKVLGKVVAVFLHRR